jgi:hypothetical protein
MQMTKMMPIQLRPLNRRVLRTSLGMAIAIAGLQLVAAILLTIRGFPTALVITAWGLIPGFAGFYLICLAVLRYMVGPAIEDMHEQFRPRLAHAGIVWMRIVAHVVLIAIPTLLVPFPIGLILLAIGIID